MKITLAVISFLVINFLLAISITKFIPYSGNFPQKEILDVYQLPTAIRSLANFDGVHYVEIASRGYQKYVTAFFPIYPGFIAFITKTTGITYVYAGISISLMACLAALFTLRPLSKMLNVSFPWLALFYLSFPTAFFLQSVYTESLFLLFIFLTFLSLFSNKGKSTFLFATLSALTRINGLLLIIPIFTYLIATKKYRQLWLVLAPLCGIGLYSLYLFINYHDPLLFFHVQSNFGGRSTHLVLLPQVLGRYLKIMLHFEPKFQFFISGLEVSLFLTSLTILLLQLLQIIKKNSLQKVPLLAINLFSLANLMLPTFTGTLLSIPRFCLTYPAIFIFLAQIKSITIKIILLILFLVSHVILFAFFLQGYFIS